MSEWRDVLISDLCAVVVDCVNKTAPVVDYPTDFKMIRTTNVRGGWVDTSSVRYVTKDVFEKWTRRCVPRRDDVVLTREAPLGGVGRLRTDENVFLGQRLMLYRAAPGISDPRFLAYSLMGPRVQEQLRAFGSGSTVEHVRVPDCEQIVVSAPDFPTQTRIGATLGSIDDLIENNRRRIELLEQMAQAIYREWIVHFRYPGHENDELVDSPLGPIPSAWRSAPLQTVADVRRGLSWEIEREVERSHPDAMSIVTIPDLGNMLTYEAKKLIEAPTTGELARFSISHGDLLLVGSNGNPDRVGHAVWVPAGRQGLFASFVIRVRTDPAAASPILMYHHMRSGRLREWLSAGAVGSTGLRNIRISALREAPTLIPDDKTLHRFEAIADPARALQDTLGAQCDALERCRDLLLPKLVTGEIDVSALDLDGFLEKAEV